MFSRVFFSCCLISFFSLPLLAQAQAGVNEFLLSDTVAVGRKLVEYAWEKYPISRQTAANLQKAKESLYQAKWNWTDRLTASFNINEGNINPGEAENNVFYPRYNLGFTLSLGTFFKTPSEIRLAKQDKLIAQDDIVMQKLAMRREVLSRYYDYLQALSSLKLKTQSYEDIRSSFTSEEIAFTNGQISLQQYNESLNMKNAAEEGRLAAEYTLAKSRFLLEEMLGAPLEVVIREIK